VSDVDRADGWARVAADTSELIWGVMAGLLPVVPILVVVAVIVWVKRATRRREDLETRIEHLEESLLEERDPKR
jgi:hypothetical protein